MRKRVLSFLLAASAAFCFICSSAPEAQAIVPIGFVQSALASYVSSTGYKLYNDNGTGQDILGSLGELYDDYVTVSNKTITGQLANLAFLVNSPYIYQDNSGQIVVSKVAADIFQDFADWIQTEYSVPIGSDQPTVVLSGGLPVWSNDAGVSAWRLQATKTVQVYSETWYIDDTPIGYVTATSDPVYIGASNSGTYIYATAWTDTSNNRLYLYTASPTTSFREYVVKDSSGSYLPYNIRYSPSQTFQNLYVPDLTLNLPVSSVDPYPYSYSDLSFSGSSASSLGVTLAQAVADVVGQAKEDDAVVVGVGASAGATAQDIADMVAQGVKAQTLDPSVSITAEAVIDTPVQPYPDIDGLGLPTLGAALVDRFPFCIPWDFVDTVKLLSADPQPINIKVDLIPQRIKTSVGITSDTSFDIDLSGEQYAKIGVFCRWGSLITFCFGLFLLTKRLVWTA